MLDSTDSLSLSLVREGLENAEAYVGLCLSFPRKLDTSVHAWYSSSLDMKPDQTFDITCRFHTDFTISHRPLGDVEAKHLQHAFPSQEATEFCIASVKLGRDLTVVGFGLLFHGENDMVDGWINKDEPIHGIIKLTQLLQQRSFMLLVHATGKQTESFFDVTDSSFNPFHYGYGDT